MVWNSDVQRDDNARISALEATVADLQRRIAALEAAGGAAGAGAESPYGTADSAGAVDPWSVPPWPEIVHLILRDKKIQAIKVYREHFAVGLKEAKEAVEEAERRVRG
ncbi:ribosomal protein L7/L12 [Pseudactinotalea sp.]|uniref:ribosomal protein L7/L12 n=1 Tax=Pseudactinotalea sp. TaxID=1926260 RepID=UPI003B3B093C